MKILRHSQRQRPVASLIFLDWSVRESFHVLHYLTNQTVPRDDYEIIVIEYYSRESEAIRRYESEVDTWILLEMPTDLYYHKHLMYNVGLVFSRGEIVIIGDSDAMVTPRFIEQIVGRFSGGDAVYHLDQFRNVRKDLYPFNFPSFEEVTGEGCINFVDGKTAGVVDDTDPIHARNYGACMCARRRDLINIGGADEHIDYLGHICGPYDMTFRLINFGRREVWLDNEFTYHTWHPGQAGDQNYLGPHDGRHLSTLALEALSTGRVMPYVENAAIRLLRTGAAHSPADVLDKLIDPRYRQDWRLVALDRVSTLRLVPGGEVPVTTYCGYRLTQTEENVLAYAPIERGLVQAGAPELRPSLVGQDVGAVEQRIDSLTPLVLRVALFAVRCGGFVSLIAQSALNWLRRPRTVAVRRATQRVQHALSTSHIGGSLRGSVLTVYNAVRSSKRSPLCVVLGDAQASSFVRLLCRMRLLPPCETRLVTSAAEMRQRLQELGRSELQPRIVIPSAVFHRFHAVVVESRLLPQMIIV